MTELKAFFAKYNKLNLIKQNGKRVNRLVWFSESNKKLSTTRFRVRVPAHK
ncbi:hypothetical protein Patl1_10998 [Pistacia atlantica]|uniref:Uncharacterized protein n=1 Tax=Pistacia atlantica TaxID=434234 RepID=A0ACC1A2J8_9ROSI|nr:hypothetical protein Patl1_10998 [Pistacia atlantica]